MEIPEKVRRSVALTGEPGHIWLAGLPQQIAELERRWAIEVGQPMRRGSEAFVAEARTTDGIDVIVKTVISGIDPMRQELRILQAADGVGYARLICSDAISNSMLLEKLGPQLGELHLTEDQQIQAICATLCEAWMSRAEEPPFPSGADKAIEFAHTIQSQWDPLGRPCSERTIERALSYAERRRRAFNPALSVLAHGDAHPWNTLAAPDSPTGFKFVDPDGAFAERAFDLAIMMREWGNAMPMGDVVRLGCHRCSRLAKFTGVERQPIWEWGLIQCVWNGLSLHRIGLDGPAAVSLAIADAWSAAGDIVA
jgi:streptomycin 6-kinase